LDGLVHSKALDGSSSYLCYSNYLGTIQIQSKVIAPAIVSGRKKPDLLLLNFVQELGIARLKQVARSAGKSEVHQVVRASARHWNQVFDFEGKIEQDFWSETDLAPLVCST